MNILKNDPFLALLAGMLSVLGFAPFGIFPIPVLALTLLFVLWSRAASPRNAAKQGFMFGLGMFTAGIGWIYIAMHDYGGMPLWLSLLAALLFAAFWSLLPAIAGFAQFCMAGSNIVRLVVVMPAMWVLFEWVRGFLVTGFPWLAMGYAQSDSPLAGYAPLLGVYGVSLAVAVSAGLLALVWHLRWNRTGQLTLVALLLIWIAGGILQTLSWTQPRGEPFSVALLQGNIPQDLKFRDDALVGTLETYRRLAMQSEARLTVMPETALPLLRHEVPPFMLERLRDHARLSGGDMLIGIFERSNGSYYNGAFTVGSAPEQRYRKQHLVPFGEFIPLRPLIGWFINGVLDIPMGDLARGDAVQPSLEIAGQRVAVDICFEDVFGEEIIRSLPEATLLVNITNDAWYGNSPVAAQHNQIAQLRALETGRMMLRATNTGVTSIIGADGAVIDQLPQHEEGVLAGLAQGYEGITPYVYWGNAAVLLMLFAMLAFAWKRRGG